MVQHFGVAFYYFPWHYRSRISSHHNCNVRYSSPLVEDWVLYSHRWSWMNKSVFALGKQQNRREGNQYGWITPRLLAWAQKDSGRLTQARENRKDEKALIKTYRFCHSMDAYANGWCFHNLSDTHTWRSKDVAVHNLLVFSAERYLTPFVTTYDRINTSSPAENKRWWKGIADMLWCYYSMTDNSIQGQVSKSLQLENTLHYWLEESVHTNPNFLGFLFIFIFCCWSPTWATDTFIYSKLFIWSTSKQQVPVRGVDLLEIMAFLLHVLITCYRIVNDTITKINY